MGSHIDAVSPILAFFIAAAESWFPPLIAAANWVFSIGIVVTIVMFAITHMVGNGFFFDLLLSRVMTILVFKFFLVNAGWIIPSILNGFIELGTGASGVRALNPAAICAQGIHLMARMAMELNAWSFFTNPFSLMLSVWAACCICIAYFVIAFTLLMGLIEGYLIIGAGILCLGFGGTSLTSMITYRYLGYTMGVGAKLMALYLMMGAADILASQWAAMINMVSIADISTMIGLVFGIAGFAVCVWTIPQIIAGLFTNSLGGGPLDSLRTSAELSRVAVNSAAAPVAGSNFTKQLGGIGKDAYLKAGGGVRGIGAGISAVGSAGAREIAGIGAPRFSHASQNLQRQRAKP